MQVAKVNQAMKIKQLPNLHPFMCLRCSNFQFYALLNLLFAVRVE